MNTIPQNTVMQYVVEQIKKHGVIVVLLAGAVYYLHERQVSLEAKIESCNSEIIELYKQKEEHFVEVIQANTRAWEIVSEKLEK